MQKILRRVAQAERQVARRTKRSDYYASREELSKNIERQKEMHAALRQDLKTSKQAMKDRWELGPLAPRQDIGLRAGFHGALDQDRYQGLSSLNQRRKEERCKWLGGSKNLNLKPGDRVVVLEGPDKGKIGPVAEIDEGLAEVTIEGLNISNIKIPDYAIQEGQPAAMIMPLPIPISAIRLVHPIKNETTGETRDVIIKQLVHGPVIMDKVTGIKDWTRIVPGLNITIPWPAEREVEHETHAVDTLRIDLDEKSFVPTLLRPPMPDAVIDELRNKYSRFRTRHDPEYIGRIEAQEAEKTKTQQLAADMRTPLQEFHREERKNNKKKGKPRLTNEMLEKIGEVIAKNREAQLNATGVSDVAPDGTSQAGGIKKEASLSTNVTGQPPSATV